MPIKLDVVKANLAFEAGYPQPEFGLVQNVSPLLDALFKRLAPHGLQLADIRIERGGDSVSDFHVLLHMFNGLMTIRVRVERIDVACAELPRDQVEKFTGVILDLLQAMTGHVPGLSFRAFAVAIALHARLEGQPLRDFLARFATNAPQNLGPPTGCGIAFNFGPEADRLLASVTVDTSAVVQEAVFIRLHAVWDGMKVPAESLSAAVGVFVNQALDSLGLQLPA